MRFSKADERGERPQRLAAALGALGQRREQRETALAAGQSVGERRCEAVLRVVAAPADTPAVQKRNHAATGGNRELAP